jgi:hypothetical protein
MAEQNPTPEEEPDMDAQLDAHLRQILHEMDPDGLLVRSFKTYTILWVLTLF